MGDRGVCSLRSEPDPQLELPEDRPEHIYREDPEEVRSDLMRLLAQARAARTLPWEPRKVRLYRTIFPHVAVAAGR